MPSQTYLNLSEEKRQRIFKAIYLELKRVPFPEMSINQIIKYAEIPRGSFYQYFENKDDAFDYFVKESSKRIKEKVIKRISTVHGDFFELCETVFDEIVNMGIDKEWLEIIKHIVPYTNMNNLQPISEYIENMERGKRLEAFSSLGIANMNIHDEDELMDIIGIVEALYQSALPRIFSGSDTDRENARKKFKRRLNLIKKVTVKEGI